MNLVGAALAGGRAGCAFENNAEPCAAAIAGQDHDELVLLPQLILQIW